MNNVEIICEGISKSFSGKTIFKNLSFKISGSGSLVITGKNGSGKSTLLKILANLIRPSEGEVSIRVSKNKIPKENSFQYLSLMSPYMALYDELTGFENLNFFYKLKSGPSDDADRVNFVMQKVGLYEKRNELLKNYSSGMNQRLKLAFAVMNNPKILLMDEPRTNLDGEGVKLIYEISNEQKGKSILIIATNDGQDKELCDNVLNIEDYN